jgi:adenylosuccinate lyase
MNLLAYHAVSPLDGRYRHDLQDLAPHVSEAALNRARLRVEAHWLLELCEARIAPKPSPEASHFLESFARGDIAPDVLMKIKAIEAQTNHDVKACEYVLRGELQNIPGGVELVPWVHFACTSEDINNLSYALNMKQLRSDVLLPVMRSVAESVVAIADLTKGQAMLSRTHGQPASPTTLGKELLVFVRRFVRQINRLELQVIEGKINGAVGSFNAHVASCPEVDWLALSRRVVEDRLGLTYNPLTTQIECHDSLVEYCQVLQQFNVIMIDFVRDVWGYISWGYFAQKTVAGETGSSTMPHKVNPIYFENAEGNLGLANSMLSHFAEKLPISRFQRDLSDSTVLRSLGSAFGYSVLAWKSTLKGLSRIHPNATRMNEDLSNTWEVLGEAIQTVMRRYGVSDAYERLKQATRGAPHVTRDMLHKLVDDCSELPVDVRNRLKALEPKTYTGHSQKLAEMYLNEFKNQGVSK